MNPFSAIRNVFAPEETPIAPRSGIIGGLITLVALAMSFLAVVAFEASIAADRIAGQWSGELAQSATVRIAAPVEDLDRVTRAALSALEIAPGVASARRLSEAELQDLLSPWLGQQADVGALPLPALIDVKIVGTGPDVADVQRQLDLVASGAIYDDHGEWRGPLLEAARGLRRLTLIGVGLCLMVLSAMVAVAAVASLWSGAGVVRTLRMIGAEDSFISHAFERQFALRAAIGGVFGSALGLFTMSRAPHITNSDILTAGVEFGQGPAWWLVIATPVACALVALLATRAASFFVLRQAG